MKNNYTFISFLLLFLLCSCGQSGSSSTEMWQKERNNIVDVQVVSIEDSLPPMHAHSNPVGIIGDTLIFKDSQSTEYIFTAYDINSGKTLGHFGRYGTGPGEIANFGSPFIDTENKILYGINGSQWVYVGFDLDQAIGNPEYNAFVKTRVINEESRMPALTCDYVNDSCVICSVWYPDKDWTSFEFRLGKFDLTKGQLTLLSEPTEEERAQYQTCASEENNLIAATGTNVDKIILYDLEGNIRKKIYGPSYSPKIQKGRYFNCSPIITDDRIFFVHRRTAKKNEPYGDEIIEMDHSGKYLRTLRVGIPIINMQYHPKTRRIYFGSTAEPQFGYIDLSSAKRTGRPEEDNPAETEVAENADSKQEAAIKMPEVKIVYSSPVAAEKPAFAHDKSRKGPLKLLDGRKRDIYPLIDQVEIADIGAMIHDGKVQRSLSFVNPGPDTLIVESVLLPDNRFEAKWQPPYHFLPNMSSSLILYRDEREYIEDYKVVIVYKNEGVAPQTLHVNIHPDVYKLHADYAASQQK